MQTIDLNKRHYRALDKASDDETGTFDKNDKNHAEAEDIQQKANFVSSTAQGLGQITYNILSKKRSHKTWALSTIALMSAHQMVFLDESEVLNPVTGNDIEKIHALRGDAALFNAEACRINFTTHARSDTLPQSISFALHSIKEENTDYATLLDGIGYGLENYPFPASFYAALHIKETGFRDVTTTAAGAEGLYQITPSFFLEILKRHSGSIAFVQDLKKRQGNNDLSKSEELLLSQINTVIEAYSADKDGLLEKIAKGRISATLKSVLDLRNNTYFATDFVATVVMEEKPELVAALRDDKNTNAFQKAFTEFYKDYWFFGETLSRQFNIALDKDPKAVLAQTGSSGIKAAIQRNPGILRPASQTSSPWTVAYQDQKIQKLTADSLDQAQEFLSHYPRLKPLDCVQDKIGHTLLATGASDIYSTDHTNRLERWTAEASKLPGIQGFSTKISHIWETAAPYSPADDLARAYGETTQIIQNITEDVLQGSAHLASISYTGITNQFTDSEESLNSSINAEDAPGNIYNLNKEI